MNTNNGSRSKDLSTRERVNFVLSKDTIKLLRERHTKDKTPMSRVVDAAVTSYLEPEKYIKNNSTDTSSEIVCLCGSMKFFNRILEEATKLTLQGKIVLTPFKDSRNKELISKEDIETYDRVHRARIDKCDRVLVVNPGRYIGESVRKEIKYAEYIGKPVSYTDEIVKPYVVTLCGSKKFIYEFRYQFEKLTKEGKIVLTPAIFEMSCPNSLDDIDHAVLDVIHRQKMEMADEVLIINKDGYIGEDTQKEIDWCMRNGIPVKFLYPDKTRKEDHNE
ncbi:MAG: hypothetical protein NC548_12905 [Lachnospiraceae bacterium]|nr:hypothetical protein [Lachnospiraceae bacterium]MCM1230710.1 hypothetical protein [Ruminococcus flavefaciens]